MEKKAVVVCCIAGFLGILSSVLGFVADATRIKASDVKIGTNGECIYPNSSSLYLGIMSAISLVLAQAIINFVAGCVCCKRNINRSKINWNVALISFAASWVAFVIAFLLLFVGATLSDRRGLHKIDLAGNCYILKAGILSAGAVLSLASVSLVIVYYAAIGASKWPQQAWSGPQNQGIALGQVGEPAFVHEDTYYRQRVP